MSEEERNVARKEIHETLNLCNFCVRNIGLSFIDIPKSFFQSLTSYLSFIMSSSLLVLMLAGFGKLITIWYKRHTFRQLVVELAEIWPVSFKDRDGVEIKRNSLSTLKHRQLLYAFWNILGVWLYNLTPIVVLVYRKLRGMPAALGYVWQMAYPFDKTKPAVHGIVYIFETCAGSSFCP
ncbi:unnamed protein product [Spodoptera exigua]|nr:unnamed protein product [Spodoptera exigua]